MPQGIPVIARGRALVAVLNAVLATAFSFLSPGSLVAAALPFIGTTDPPNLATAYAYDALDRLKALTYADESLGFTYDDPAIAPNSRGRLSRVTDGSGSTTYAYDPQGRVTVKTQVTGAVVKAVGYAYNAAGQLATLTTASNQLVEYGYANNQVVSVKVNGIGVLSGARYFPFGEVASWTWGNGKSYVRTYDRDGRIGSVTLGSHTRRYGFDDASRITSLADAQGATSLASATIGYDTLNRAAGNARYEGTSQEKKDKETKQKTGRNTDVIRERNFRRRK